MHNIAEGKWVKCAFVEAELAEENINPPGIRLLGVYRNRSTAVQQASRQGGALLWCGQSPVEMWLVVKKQS